MAGENAKKALKFVKKTLSLAPYIMIVIICLGLVLKMAGVECLTAPSTDANGPINTMSTSISVEGDGNYHTVTTAAGYYDYTNQAYVQPTTTKDTTLNALGNYRYYGTWINSNTVINTGDRFNVNVSGTVNVCDSTPKERIISVSATANDSAYSVLDAPVPGAYLWLDATDPFDNGQPPANGAGLTSWMDKSGHGNNAVGTPTATPPVYKSSGAASMIYSHPVINFNGTNQYFEIPYSADLNNSKMTIFVVSRAHSTGASLPHAALFNGNGISGADTQGYIFYGDQATNNWGLWTKGVAAGQITSAVSGGGDPTAAVILAAKLDDTTSPNVSNLYVNGSQITSSVHFYAHKTAGALRIGAGGTSTAVQFFSGDIAEILVYNRLLDDATERTKVEAYLANKWQNATIAENARWTTTAQTATATAITAQTVQYNSSGQMIQGARPARAAGGADPTGIYVNVGDTVDIALYNASTYLPMLNPVDEATTASYYLNSAGGHVTATPAGNKWAKYDADSATTYPSPGVQYSTNDCSPGTPASTYNYYMPGQVGTTTPLSNLCGSATPASTTLSPAATNYSVSCKFLHSAGGYATCSHSEDTTAGWSCGVGCTCDKCPGEWCISSSNSTGNFCWAAQGLGLKGMIDDGSGWNNATQLHSGGDLNSLLTPHTADHQGAGGLAGNLQRDNYYGYYVGNSTQAGYLKFKIQDPFGASTNFKTTSTNPGGYTVRVKVTPPPCNAQNGLQAYGSAGTGGNGKIIGLLVPSGQNPNNRDDNGDPRTPATGTPITFNYGATSASYVDPGSSVSTPSTLWFKVQDSNHIPFTNSTDPNMTYAENTGSYQVSVTKSYTTGVLSHMIMDIVHLITPTIVGDTYSASGGVCIDPVNGIHSAPVGGSCVKMGIIQSTFEHLQDASVVPQFIKAVRALVIIYIIFYFIMFMMGMIHVSQFDLVMRIIKMSIVMALITPGSWDFFNNNLFILFTKGGQQLLNLMTGNLADPSDHGFPFVFVDKTVGQFFSGPTIVKVLALFMVYPIGWFYVPLIALSMWDYTIAVFKAVVTYLISLFIVGFLLTLAPIFISFMLFEKTKGIFESWLRILCRFTLEPIMLFVGLTIVNEFVNIAVFGILNNPPCWKCALEVDIPGYGDLFCFYFYMPWGYNAANTANFLDFGAQLLVNVLVLEIFASLAGELVNLMPRIAGAMTGTSALNGWNLTGNIRTPQGTPGGHVQDKIDKLTQTTGGRSSSKNDPSGGGGSGGAGGKGGGGGLTGRAEHTPVPRIDGGGGGRSSK